MTKEEFEKFIAAHPGISHQFESNRRVWVSHLPSVHLPSFTGHLSTYLECDLACTQMEPELEFVFYDPHFEGNSQNALINAAKERAGEFLPG